jgi:acyl-coenzyme A synthetase/AMP-(fatty) acid ligase
MEMVEVVYVMAGVMKEGATWNVVFYFSPRRIKHQL